MSSKSMVPRLALLATGALLCSLTYLGFKFASVVSMSSEDAMRRIHAGDLLGAKHRPSDMIFKSQLAEQRDLVKDLVERVNDLSSLTKKQVESDGNEIKKQINDLAQGVNQIKASLANISDASMEFVRKETARQAKRVSEKVSGFETSFSAMQQTLKRLDGKLAAFLDVDFARRGDVHRWLVGPQPYPVLSPGGGLKNKSLGGIPVLKDMKVAWKTECGCTGIALEAMNLVYPLWKAGLQIWLNKCDKPCDYDLPPDLDAMIKAMDRTRPKKKTASKWGSYSYSWRAKPKPSKNEATKLYDIAVLHIAYAGICSVKDDESDSRYVISRSMYESDRIKTSEAARCNKRQINEVWVPTEFNVDSFAASGVEVQKLFKVPEGIDMVGTWNPAVVEAALSKSRNQSTKASSGTGVLEKMKLGGTKAGWNFFSLFKFEQRKNWKGLLEAYLTEFKKSDDVCFYLKTHEGWEGDPETWIKRFMRTLVKRGQVRVESMPCIYLIDQMIDASDLPKLFYEMDAFVLVSHAEGWGLPAMEAMAMELPVAVTDWGGVTEFSSGYRGLKALGLGTSDSWGRFPGGYAVRVDKLEPAFSGRGSGDWAVPSVDHLRGVMRHMYNNQKEARDSGKQGRQRVLRYDRNAVAAGILQSFNDIHAHLQRVEAEKRVAALRDSAKPQGAKTVYGAKKRSEKKKA